MVYLRSPVLSSPTVCFVLSNSTDKVKTLYSLTSFIRVLFSVATVVLLISVKTLEFFVLDWASNVSHGRILKLINQNRKK